MVFSLLDIFYPKYCVSCGKWGNYLCQACKNLAHVILYNETICPVCERPAMYGRTHPICFSRYALDGLTSFYHYKGPVKSVIQGIKYKSFHNVAQCIIEMIPEESLLILQETIRANDLRYALSPLPLHAFRLRKRGFNQASVLGAHLSRRLHVKFIDTLLVRSHNTLPQVAMKNRRDRIINMRGAFALGTDARMLHTGNCGIILFDDVFTTGATMREAAKAIKRGGASFVWGVTLAR